MKRAMWKTALVTALLLLAGSRRIIAQGTGVPDDIAATLAAQDTGQTQLFLPVVANDPITAPYDMARLLVGDARLYEVQHSSGSQARHQTQVEDTLFFHTKGDEINAEWEELWYTDALVYRGTDTSPGNGQYYTLRDAGMYGSAWSPRFWEVGELFERNPFVTFYSKADCGVVLAGSQRSWLKFESFYPLYTFASGITLENVVQLAWLLEPDGEPIERYFYAYHFGLVGWWSSTSQNSYISEIHEPGTRPDSKREVIPCLDRSPLHFPVPAEDSLPFWPGDQRR